MASDTGVGAKVHVPNSMDLRIRTSTAKGHELYSTRVQTLTDKVKQVWHDLE